MSNLNITFNYLRVGNDMYDSLDNLPAEAQAALVTFSQMINVSENHMGSIHVAPGALQHYGGTFAPGGIYSYRAHRNWTFEFPDVSWCKEDVGFVLYATFSQYINVTFPTGTLFIGNAPSSTAGTHKWYCWYIRDIDAWAILAMNPAEPE